MGFNKNIALFNSFEVTAPSLHSSFIFLSTNVIQDLSFNIRDYFICHIHGYTACIEMYPDCT